MEKQKFEQIEAYMLSCMKDSAHDREHVRRVLHTALLIAGSECDVDWDVLICSALLHDIGRPEQFADPTLCHATVGGEKAYRFLVSNGYSQSFAEKVRHCIVTHRFRVNYQPESLEAKILFDADKLDAVGAMGIARSLLYQGHEGIPIYTLTNDEISDGTGDEPDSFFREYRFKLEKLYDRFYTEKGKALAQQRQKAAVDFYQALLQEVRQSHSAGKATLEAVLIG